MKIRRATRRSWQSPSKGTFRARRFRWAAPQSAQSNDHRPFGKASKRSNDLHKTLHIGGFPEIGHLGENIMPDKNRFRCETCDIEDTNRHVNRLRRRMAKDEPLGTCNTDDPPLGICMDRSTGRPTLDRSPPSHLLARVPLPGHRRFPRLGQLYGSRELAACGANAPITRQAHPA